MIYLERLRDIRKEEEITQAELSSLLGIHEYVYGQYEREYVIMPLKHLDVVANKLDVSIDYLFGFTNQKKYKNSSLINLEKSSFRIKELRKEKHLTQKKLASILNTVQPVIANYENGKHLISTPFLYTICKKYQISADYLLGKTDYKY